MPPLRAGGFGSHAYYIDAEEIPQQINPLGLKRILKHPRFCLKSGAVGNADRIWVSTPQNRTYRAWGVVARLKTSPTEITFNKIIFMRHALIANHFLSEDRGVRLFSPGTYRYAFLPVKYCAYTFSQSLFVSFQRGAGPSLK